MTSKIKVDNINKVSDDSNIIKKCGTTTTIGSGASNPIVVDGSAITLGRCGGTVALASGATQTGFGRTGTVDWQTTSKTATFTAVSGEGYFANTSGSAFNMNLPAGSAGAIVSVADYAETFNSNNLTIVPNGTDKIGSQNENAVLNTKGQSVTLVYVDGTQGWINTMDSTSNVRGQTFVAATGGTIITTGNFKTHVFTGPGTFCVSSGGSLDYFVVAGGGGTNWDRDAGAGAGGFRLSNSVSCVPAPTMSPLSNPTGICATVQGYPITVGSGGAAIASGGTTNPGSNSIFSSITSAGGGGSKQTGGSGGGGRCGPNAGAAGNTPPVSPPQGNNGGLGLAYNLGTGGGGGAGAVGADGTPGAGGAGGTGSFLADTFIGPTAPSYGTPGPVGSTRYFAGGGGGAKYPSGTGGAGGTGGGGAAGVGQGVGTSGTVNTGGGAGGSGANGGTAPNGASGGSGIVIIRYKFQ